MVLCKTVVTVTTEHAPSPVPAASTFDPPAPVGLVSSTVIVRVEVEVVVSVVPWSHGVGEGAKCSGAAEETGSELAPAAKFAGAAELAGAAVELCTVVRAVT